MRDFDDAFGGMLVRHVHLFAADALRLRRIGHAATYQGRGLAPCKVSWQNEVRLRFAIKNVQPGELRHRCREGGLEVVSIRRLRIGRVALAKVPVGQWRYLPPGTRF